MELILKLNRRKASIVNETLKNTLNRLKEPQKIFRSITSDNGLEFAKLCELEKTYIGNIYYCHPNNP